MVSSDIWHNHHNLSLSMIVHFRDPNCGHTLQPALLALIVALNVRYFNSFEKKTWEKACLHFYKIDSSKGSNSTQRVKHMLVIRLKNREAVFEKAYKQVFPQANASTFVALK